METCTTIVIPTWTNVQCLIACLESLHDLTMNARYRIVVIDNGSTDDTPKYLEDAKKRMPLTIIRNAENLGFVKATNQGLREAKSGEYVLWLNDDTQIVDPLWLSKMVDILDESKRIGTKVGAVGAVSNFVMGLQQVALSPQIPHLTHKANFLIGFCLLVRDDAFADVGLLDERFLQGGNDDLDYAIRLTNAGYEMKIDRRVFVLHYGAQSIQRIGGYQKVEAETRPLLIEKWGKERVEALFQPPSVLAELFGGQDVHQPKG